MTTKVIFLKTTGSVLTWTVPTDFNPRINTIHCIGGGGGGAGSGSDGASGGGGGAYSAVSNVSMAAILGSTAPISPHRAVAPRVAAAARLRPQATAERQRLASARPSFQAAKVATRSAQ
jgi:hypothetical protein